MSTILVSGLFYCRIDFDDALAELSAMANQKLLDLSVILQTEMAPRDFYNILQRNLGEPGPQSPIGGSLSLLGNLFYLDIGHKGCVTTGFIQELLTDDKAIELGKLKATLVEIGIHQPIAGIYTKRMNDGGILVLAKCADEATGYYVRDILKYKCAYDIHLSNRDERELIFERPADEAEFEFEQQDSAA
jgi:hypothetical protein